MWNTAGFITYRPAIDSLFYVYGNLGEGDAAAGCCAPDFIGDLEGVYTDIITG